MPNNRDNMRGLHRLAKDTIARADELLLTSPYCQDDDGGDIGMRVWFWSTLMTMAQERLQAEMKARVERMVRPKRRRPATE